MNKRLDGVLDRVSENNNEYRSILRNLNNKIDEKATSIIGDIVTLSNYSLDFSNAINKVKEKLVKPISRIVENYAIKDLRSVESVNEQFVEKINDKIENSKIDSAKEKEKFIENLNNLLNNKYLQIVKIKRTDFFDGEKKNSEIENIITEFINFIKENGLFDEIRLYNIFNEFVSEIYKEIELSLSDISNLYLDNFVNAVKESLLSSLNLDENSALDNNDDNNIMDTYMPEINPVDNVDIPIGNLDNNIEVNSGLGIDLESKSLAEFDISNIPTIPDDIPLNNNIDSEVVKMDIPKVEAVEVKEDVIDEKPKYSYDVEEILKIAKSPVASISKQEETINTQTTQESNHILATSNIDDHFNERQLVEEMIRRLSSRLDEIDKRQMKLDDDDLKIKSDENFVNELINNAKNKKEELDDFEKSLDEKEKELNEKEKELNEKIQNIMPFANAVLKTEQGSKI